MLLPIGAPHQLTEPFKPFKKAKIVDADLTWGEGMMFQRVGVTAEKALLLGPII